MSWSLQLRNGDLALGGASLGTVMGGTKLVQDLRCALMERRGHDDAHPTFGSNIDGGRDEYGNEVPSLIGSSNWNLIALRVQTEINRICAEHQAGQLERSRNDRIHYGRSTLDPSELLVEVSSVDMFQTEDKLLAHVVLSTGNGSTTAIDIPLSNEPAITI
jgi:hypothetical protein